MPQKRTIILARHGSTDLNDDQDKIRGWKDIPLNEHGRQQAEVLAQKLKKEKIDFIITSNLKRAEETAHIISAAIKKPVIDAVKALRPWHLGDFQGVESKIVVPQLDNFVKQHPNQAVPGGESFNDFKKRCLEGVKKILEDNPDKVILIVCHHRNDRLLDAWTKGSGGENIDMKTFLSKGIEPGDYKLYHVYVI